MIKGYNILVNGYSFLAGILFFVTVPGSAQGIYNNGANIVLTSSSNIYVDGSTGQYRSESNGIIKNSTTGGTISLVGNWLNNGGNSGFTNDGTTVVFKGAGQSIDGSSSTTFYKLSASGSGAKTFDKSSSVSNLVSVDGVTLNANGKLTLLATATTNANLGELLNGASVTNNVIVQSYFTGGDLSYRSYKGLSSPINDALILSGDKTYKQLQSKLIVTGAGGTANGFDKGSVNSPSAVTIRSYYEPTPRTGNSFIGLSNINNSTTPGTGFFFYYRGSRSSDYNSSGTYATGLKVVAGASYAVPENLVAEYTGPVNQGNITVNLSYTDNGDSDPNTGINLVGNPYPSVIDWHIVKANSTSDVSPITYVLKPTGSFATYSSTAGPINGGSQYIMPGTAFYVKANAASQSIHFTESAKAPSATPLRFLSAPEHEEFLTGLNSVSEYKSPAASSVRKIILDLQSSDIKEETMIAFINGANTGYDNEDGIYMPGGPLSFSSISSDNLRMAINAMPPVDEASEIKLMVNAGSGSCKLNFKDLSALGSMQVFLKDSYLNKLESISTGSAYEFAIDKKVADSYGEGRFTLVFKPQVNIPSLLAKKIYSGSELSWSLQRDANATFEIERSADGISFDGIGAVTNAAKEKLSYSFVDNKPETGLNYYRLKLVEPSGVFSYTNIVSLDYNLDSNEQNFKIYPNPVDDVLSVTFSRQLKKAQLVIYDLGGRKIKTFSVSDSNTASQNVSELSTGIYVIQLTDDQNKELGTQKFLKN